MAKGSAQQLKKKSSSLHKTGSNLTAGQSKSKILTAVALANDDEDGGGLLQQGSNPFQVSTRSTNRQVSNSQLTSSEAKSEHPLQGNTYVKLPVEPSNGPIAGDLLSLTGSERAKVKARTERVRSTQSALLAQAASKPNDPGPSTGPSSVRDTLSSSKTQAVSPSNVPSSAGSTVPLRTTAPLGSNPGKLMSGMSVRSIKSTMPSQSISRQSPDTSTSPSPTGAPQDPSSQNPSKSKPDSTKSSQSNVPGQAQPQIRKTSSQGMISVPSDKSRKLTRASEAVRQWIWGSKHSVISQANNLGAKRLSRDSIMSQIKSQQLAAPSRTENKFAVRSSKTPGLGTSSRTSVATHHEDRSVSVLVLESFNSAHSSSSIQRATSNRIDEDIRLLTSKLSSVKMDSKHELDLPIRMEMCPCPDMNAEYDDEDEEEEEEHRQSFHSSMKSKHPQQYKRSIRNVKRSPFERKDRAARQEFLKELERMEISEIAKKQKAKPRRIKKYLKKEGVYQTIKDANLIPDSHTDTSPRHSSAWSIATYGENEQAKSSYSASPVSPQESEESDRIDRFQLRGHHSVGSRAAAGLPLLREEAFLEIELSEADDVDPTPKSSFSLSSSSATEVLSSSSEISLRVNLEKARSPADNKKIKIRNAPYVTYKNKIDKEIEAGRSKSIHDSTQENLIIEKIATEFGEWAKENGLKPEAVEKDIIKELFQFGTMDTAANSIAVEIKELVIVRETITEGLYPELEERAALYRQILWDEMAYWKKERSMAFGKPDPFPYKRPPQQPLPLWTKSGFVPLPLSTGELLYQSLINNESLMLERYVLWMVENPKYHRPPYLIKSGYFQKTIDKYGGDEDIIRQKSNAAKHLVNSTGKNLAGLNIGMKTELRKLKEMAKADFMQHSNR